VTDPSTARAATGTIECSSEPGPALAVIADPRHLPTWAPGFADTIQGDRYEGWRVTKDGREFAIRVPVDRDAGTVDFLRRVGVDEETGAYVRVVGRLGGGSVLIMTLPVLPGTDPAEVTAVLSEELAALATLITTVPTGGARP
jgi:hypothetical protein